MTTLESLKAAQRSAPTAPQTKDMQRAYQAQLATIARADRAAEHRERSRAEAAAFRAAVEAELAAHPGETSLPREAWLTLASRTGEPLKVGTALTVHLLEIATDEDGADLAGFATGVFVSGIVKKVGAHWSDQPHGQSGWHYLVACRVPLEFAGKKIAL